MNKVVFLMVFGFLNLFALDFYEYEEALALQKKTGKVILVEAMRSDCHYCADMKKKVFDDEKMSRWIKKHFIPVQINLDFDAMPLGLKVVMTPSFFFIDKHQKVVKRFVGSWNIQDFKDLTKNIK